MRCIRQAPGRPCMGLGTSSAELASDDPLTGGESARAMVRMRGIRVPALLVALVVAVAGCGSAAGRTETGVGSSGVPAQTVPDFYGITSGGDIAHFSDGTWTTQKPDLPAGEKLDRISWSHSPDARPLVTTEPATGLGGSDCNPGIRWVGPDGKLSAAIAHGVSPSLSPDGRHLAYLALGPMPPMEKTPPAIAHCGMQRLVVEDLDTGVAHEWAASYTRSSTWYVYGYIETYLSWSPDSTHLVFGTQEGRLYNLAISAWKSGATVQGASELQPRTRSLSTRYGMISQGISLPWSPMGRGRGLRSNSSIQRPAQVSGSLLGV